MSFFLVNLPHLLRGALVLIFFVVTPFVQARDKDGLFEKSPLHDWFESLRSGKGPCCSDADGSAISDADWESKDGHYRVHIRSISKDQGDMVWIDVPDEAVITQPNLYGRTMVWPIYNSPLGGPIKPQIRCFMPGSMT